MHFAAVKQALGKIFLRRQLQTPATLLYIAQGAGDYPAENRQRFAARQRGFIVERNLFYCQHNFSLSGSYSGFGPQAAGQTGDTDNHALRGGA